MHFPQVFRVGVAFKVKHRAESEKKKKIRRDGRGRELARNIQDQHHSSSPIVRAKNEREESSQST